MSSPDQTFVEYSLRPHQHLPLPSARASFLGRFTGVILTGSEAFSLFPLRATVNLKKAGMAS